MNDLETARKAREAAAWVGQHGFIQESRWDGGTGHCALGLIERVHGFGAYTCENFPSSRALMNAIAEELPSNPRGSNWAVAAWNNRPGRTPEEVADLFESTALALEVRALAAESVSGNPDVPVVAETPDYAKVAS